MNRYIIILTITVLIIFYTNLHSQDLAPLNYDSFSKTFNSRKSQTTEVNFQTKNSVVTALFHDGIHSRHSAPQSLFRYARCYFLILSSEMQVSGFPSNVNITSLGYNYKYGTDLATKGYFKVYFQNTTDVVNNKSTNWNSAIQQMSLVHSDTLQIPTESGIFDIPLNASGIFTYTGAGIYVAFEYSNPAGPLAVVSNVAWANKMLPNPILKSSQSDDSLRVIATGSSNLRPETRFGCNLTDIVMVGPVYSMGVMGISPGIDTNFVKAVVNHTRDAEDTIIVTTKVKKVIDSNGTGVFNFINVNSDSCYYYEVRHRNHIRTFSNSLCQKLKGAPAFYNFTSSASQALGYNMIFISGQFSSGGFAIYAGDVNQDGIVDASDASGIENDAANFVMGYVITDLTGDNVTDASDAAIVDNNALNFVSVIRP